jgi:hypothetical protein
MSGIRNTGGNILNFCPDKEELRMTRHEQASSAPVWSAEHQYSGSEESCRSQEQNLYFSQVFTKSSVFLYSMYTCIATAVIDLVTKKIHLIEFKLVLFHISHWAILRTSIGYIPSPFHIFSKY